MIVIKPHGSPPSVSSERAFFRHLHHHQGILLANINVPNHASSARTREVDGVLLTPAGLFTIEVKGTRASGTLATPGIDPWTITPHPTDADPSPTPIELPDRPHVQALTHSKYLATFLRTSQITPGWIQPCLVFVADHLDLPDGAPVHAVENVAVTIAGPDTVPLLAAHAITRHYAATEVSIERVQAILGALGCISTAPGVGDLIAEGFRAEADILAELDQARDQATETTTDRPDLDQNDGDGQTSLDIAEHPAPDDAHSDDPDLRLVYASHVNGINFHHAAVEYAHTHDLSLDDLAAQATEAISTHPGDDHLLTHHTGTGHVLTLRPEDALVVKACTETEYEAMQHGANVHGIELTARAARVAIENCRLSLDAVARIVTTADARWWASGVPNVVHARGDFAAVTSGATGPVLDVLLRSRAARAALRHHATAQNLDGEAADTPPVTDPATDTSPDNAATIEPTEPTREPSGPHQAPPEGPYTLSAEALRQSYAQHTSIAALTEAAKNPRESHPHPETGKMVHIGNHAAVVVDPRARIIEAGLTLDQAHELVHGSTIAGVHLTPAALHALRHQHATMADALKAYRDPELVATSPDGATRFHTRGPLGIEVDLATSRILDVTEPAAIKALLAEGHLVPHLDDTPTSGSSDATPTAAGLSPLRMPSRRSA